MKKLIALVLALTLVFSFAACAKQEAEETVSNETTVAASLWDNATYKEDTTLGEGANSFDFVVSMEDKDITLTINTDLTNVGKALVDLGIVSGEEGDYGLYVKTVDGVTCDYDVDQTYWSFYIGDEMASASVDNTEIEDGVVYKMIATKG